MPEECLTAKLEKLRRRVQQYSEGNHDIRIKGDFVYDPICKVKLSLMARVASFHNNGHNLFSEDDWLLSNQKGRRVLRETWGYAEEIFNGGAYRFNYGGGRSCDVEEDSQNFWIDVKTRNKRGIDKELRWVRRLCGKASRKRGRYREWAIPILNASELRVC